MENTIMNLITTLIGILIILQPFSMFLFLVKNMPVSGLTGYPENNPFLKQESEKQ